MRLDDPRLPALIDAWATREPDDASDEETPAPHKYRTDCGCDRCLHITDQMGDDE